MSSAEVEREREEWLGPDPSPFMRDFLARLPEPAEKPGYQRMIVDDDGNVWAGEYLGLARRDEPQEWYVLDSAGRVARRRRQAPARFELMRVGADEVFGVAARRRRCRASAGSAAGEALIGPDGTFSRRNCARARSG